MKIEIVKYVCDLCKKEARDMNLLTIPVVFTTEQTEGRSVKPYITHATLDICDVCQKKLIETIPVRGVGAQGHNEYKWHI